MTPTVHRDITGIILVGGKSRRMGRDKAFIEIGGAPLFEKALELFRASFPEVLLIGDRPERFERYGLPVLPDLYPGSSLGGLYTGLHAAPSPYVFVSSCDLPCPSPEILQHLCSLRKGFDAVVPRTSHGWEPLFALYSKSCLEPMRAQLDTGHYCAYDYFPRISVREVTAAELAQFDRAGTGFVNLNTPEELKEMEGKL
jgi:molybdopterin-guanine dinucleotide biosynthesis protein A